MNYFTIDYKARSTTPSHQILSSVDFIGSVSSLDILNRCEMELLEYENVKILDRHGI